MSDLTVDEHGDEVVIEWCRCCCGPAEKRCCEFTDWADSYVNGRRIRYCRTHLRWVEE